MFPFKKAMEGVAKERREPSISEEEVAMVRSIKKSKGDIVDDVTMDEEMVEKAPFGSNSDIQGPLLSDGTHELRGSKTVSYMDKVLCLNGEGNESESEEECWMDVQRKEEEEDGLPDVVLPPGTADPLNPFYSFSRRQHKEDCKKWRSTLVLKLMGKKIASRFFIPRLRRLWNLMGDFKVVEMDNGYLSLKFNEERDYLHVLQEGPWVVADHYVLVQRWRPFFDPYNEEVRKLAVWLRIPGLPNEFYTFQHLWRIGNVFGKTLKVDKVSFKKDEGGDGDTDKARFARLCVEVDLRRSLISKFRIWDYILEEEVSLNVGYEGLHLVCFACGKYGHRKENCNGGLDFRVEKAKEASVGTTQNVNEGAGKEAKGPEVKSMSAVDKVEEAAFGEWMVVKRKNKGRKPKTLPKPLANDRGKENIAPVVKNSKAGPVRQGNSPVGAKNKATSSGQKKVPLGVVNPLTDRTKYQVAETKNQLGQEDCTSLQHTEGQIATTSLKQKEPSKEGTRRKELTSGEKTTLKREDPTILGEVQRGKYVEDKRKEKKGTGAQSSLRNAQKSEPLVVQHGNTSGNPKHNKASTDPT